MTELLTLATSLPLADTDWGWDSGPWFLLVPLFWIAVVFAFFWLFRGRGGRGGLGSTDKRFQCF